jgi:hypothetical protein
MEPVSEELVEETWQETAGFNPKQISKVIKNVGKTQPHLLTFILEFTQDLDQEVKELAVYMFLNLYRMFRKGYKNKIRKISTKEIIECYEHNEKFIESLEGVHNKFLDRIAGLQLSDQPNLIKYVLESFYEVSEDEDSVSLTDDDTGYLFLLFRTVIDTLNKITDS